MAFDDGFGAVNEEGGVQLVSERIAYCMAELVASDGKLFFVTGRRIAGLRHVGTG